MITFTVKRCGGRIIGEIVHDSQKCLVRPFSGHPGDRAFFGLVQLNHGLMNKVGMPTISNIHASLEDCYFILTDPDNQAEWGVEVTPSRTIEREYGPPPPPGAVT